jgi:general secretion pathway protein G
MNTQKKNGFTMMELLIVIIILGILATLVLPDLFSKSEQAKRDLTCLKMNGVTTALKSFRSDNGEYPSTKEGLGLLLENSDSEKYPKYNEVPYLSDDNGVRDSWGSDYIYIKEDSGFTLMSLGSNMQEGGEKFEKDFNYKECKK